MKLPLAPKWLITLIATILGLVVTALIWVNIPIALIVLFVGVIGLIGLIIPKLRLYKTILYRLISDTIVLNIEESEEVKGDVQVLFKGEEVKGNIHLVLLKIWNASNEPIMDEDYKSKAIRLNFGKEAKIFSVEVSESKPPGFKKYIDDNTLVSFDTENVVITPTWLDVDNSFTLKILISNFQGDVSTDESRIILGGIVRNWNDTFYRKIKDFIDNHHEGLIFTIFSILSSILFILLIWLLSFFYQAPKNQDIVTSLIIFTIIVIVPMLIALYIMKKFIINRLDHLFD